MSYDIAVETLLKENGVELSTMMGSPCLRYKDDFIGMFFDKANALIIKVSADRVNELIELGKGEEFNFTKKRFKEWVLIPMEQVDQYPDYFKEALAFAKSYK